ncbi:MAG: type II secretion system protein [Candidatus Methylomirabilia bacterium]
MKKLRSQEGFTLIELVIIILVLGILAATAIPKFYDMSAKAKEAAEKGVVGGVRGGIAIMYASNLLNGVSTYPAALGGAAGAASPSNLLFSSVIAPGIDADWSMSGTSVYWGPAGNSYGYTSAVGTFQ